MEKAITVYGDETKELNKLLEAGWTVKTTCPMPSSGSEARAFYPQCLVIVTNDFLK